MKQTFRITLVLCVFMALFGCQADLYDEAIKADKRQLKVEHFSLESAEAKSNFQLMEAVAKVQAPKGSGVVNRTVYDSINKFYFDDEKGIKIERDSIVSYTFSIYPVDGNEENVKNLLFMMKEGGDFDAYIVKYGYTKPESFTLTDVEKAQKEIEYYSVVDGRIKLLLICVEVQESNPLYHDCSATHPNGYTCNVSQWITVSTSCTWLVTGGGGNGDGGPIVGNTGGGGGGPTNPPPIEPPVHGPIITLPVLEEIDPDDPCLKLKALLQNQDLKAALVQNKNDVTEVTYEKGYKVVKQNEAMNTTALTNNSADCSSLEFTPEAGWIGALHCHPDKNSCELFAMFSWADIYKLYEIVKNYAPSSGTTPSPEAVAAFQDFFVTVATVNGTYLIHIDNLSMFWTSMYNLSIPYNFARFKRLLTQRNESHRSHPLALINNDSNELENDFLQFSNSDFQLGISLYKLNAQMTNWSHIHLVQNQRTSTPCN